MSIRISLVTVLLFFLLFVPLGGLFAQFPGGSGNGIVPCDGPDCDICSLAALGQGIINFAVYFSVIVATLLFVYAGFLYITAQGNPAQVSKATGVFKKVLIGMIIVLASWLIVDLIMTTFASKSFGPWNQIVCDGSFSGGSGSNTLGSGNPDDLSGGGGGLAVSPATSVPIGGSSLQSFSVAQAPSSAEVSQDLAQVQQSAIETGTTASTVASLNVSGIQAPTQTAASLQNRLVVAEGIAEEISASSNQMLNFAEAEFADAGRSNAFGLNSRQYIRGIRLAHAADATGEELRQAIRREIGAFYIAMAESGLQSSEAIYDTVAVAGKLVDKPLSNTTDARTLEAKLDELIAAAGSVKEAQEIFSRALPSVVSRNIGGTSTFQTGSAVDMSINTLYLDHGSFTAASVLAQQSGGGGSNFDTEIRHAATVADGAVRKLREQHGNQRENITDLAGVGLSLDEPSQRSLGIDSEQIAANRGISKEALQAAKSVVATRGISVPENTETVELSFNDLTLGRAVDLGLNIVGVLSGGLFSMITATGILQEMTGLPSIGQVIDGGGRESPSGTTGFEGSPEIGGSRARSGSIERGPEIGVSAGPSVAGTNPGPTSNTAPAVQSTDETSGFFGNFRSVAAFVDFLFGREEGGPSPSGTTGFEGSPEIGGSRAPAGSIARGPEVGGGNNAGAGPSGNTGFEGSPETGGSRARSGSVERGPEISVSTNSLGKQVADTLGSLGSLAVNSFNKAKDLVGSLFGTTNEGAGTAPSGTTGFEGSPEIGGSRAPAGSIERGGEAASSDSSAGDAGFQGSPEIGGSRARDGSVERGGDAGGSSGGSSGADSEGGGFGCFVGATHVLMADGTTKPIADVRVGDYVAAFDGLGALTPRRVTNIFSYEDREVVELNEVRVTSEHRFLLANGMYKRVNELVEGDVLVATDGSFVPEWSVVPIAGTYTVHNLTVEGTHTYVAGGFRVHNIK
jgi:hypothetical protein